MSLARRVDRLTFAYDRHGCAGLQADLNLPLRDGMRLYDTPGVPRALVAYAGCPVWAGRLEEVSVNSAGGTRMVAAGGWQAYQDVPYTALWSDTRVSEWRPVITTEEPTAFPDRFTFDTNNRVYITANKGDTLGTTTTTKVGYMVYFVPDQGSRSITNISFDYSFSSQSSWQMGVISFDDSWTSDTIVYSLNGAGAGVVTGSQSLTLGTPRNRITFYLYYTGADTAVTAETGDIYARFTNIRLKTTTVSTVLGSDIVAALATYVDTINASQVAGSRIQNVSTLDLQDELYEDQYPADIIERLELIDGRQAVVDLNGTLIYRTPVPETYRILADIQAERALDRVRNRRYGVYQEAAGRTLRTANADNSESYARYGVRRSAPVAVRSTSSSQATTERDTALGDTDNPSPRSRIRIRRLLSRYGVPIPLHLPQYGDTALLGAIPPSISAVDQIRSFTIARTEVRLTRGADPELVLEPDEPVPNLETLLARREATT